MAAAGKQADEVLAKAVAAKDYICIVEGGIPTVPGHGMIGGRRCSTSPRRCRHAKPVIAIGSCAVDGGVPAAAPNPSKILRVERPPHEGESHQYPVLPREPGVAVASTAVYVLTTGKFRPFYRYGRPLTFFGRRSTTTVPVGDEHSNSDGGRFVDVFGTKEEAWATAFTRSGARGPGLVRVPRDAMEFEAVVVHRDRRAVHRGAQTSNGATTSPVYGKLANVSLPYGDVTAGQHRRGPGGRHRRAIAGHAVVKAVRGKSGDGGEEGLAALPQPNDEKGEAMAKRVVIDPVPTHRGAPPYRGGGGERQGQGRLELRDPVPRLEILLKGRDPRDAWFITQRICGVCPVSHGHTSTLSIGGFLRRETPRQRADHPEPDRGEPVHPLPHPVVLSSERVGLRGRGVRPQGEPEGEDPPGGPGTDPEIRGERTAGTLRQRVLGASGIRASAGVQPSRRGALPGSPRYAEGGLHGDRPARREDADAHEHASGWDDLHSHSRSGGGHPVADQEDPALGRHGLPPRRTGDRAVLHQVRGDREGRRELPRLGGFRGRLVRSQEADASQRRDFRREAGGEGRRGEGRQGIRRLLMVLRQLGAGTRWTARRSRSSRKWATRNTRG